MSPVPGYGVWRHFPEIVIRLFGVMRIYDSDYVRLAGSSVFCIAQQIDAAHLTLDRVDEGRSGAIGAYRKI